MAASDAVVAFSQIDQGAVTLTTGASTTYTITVLKGTVDWTVATPPVTEMLVRNQHFGNVGGTTTVRRTGDAMVTGTIKLHGCSFLGSAALSPYELLTAGAMSSRGAGDGGLFSMAIPYSGGGGAPTQTATFGFVRFSNVAIAYEEGLLTLTADFTDYENKPTIA